MFPFVFRGEVNHEEIITEHQYTTEHNYTDVLTISSKRKRPTLRVRSYLLLSVEIQKRVSS